MRIRRMLAGAVTAARTVILPRHSEHSRTSTRNTRLNGRAQGKRARVSTFPYVRVDLDRITTPRKGFAASPAARAKKIEAIPS
jgi:hypothetical protein